MKDDKNSEQLSPELLTTEEAAKVLRLSPKALYKRIDRGQIKGVVKLGNRSYRFLKEKLLSSLK